MTPNQQNQLKTISLALAGAAAAVAMVFGFEGTVNTGYKDPVGIPTACTGSTTYQGKPVVVGQHYTDAQCMDMLAVDLVHTAVNIQPCIHVEVPNTTMAAFVSFSYNVGPRAFCNSTLVRKLNARDYKGACAELSRWTHAGGRELPGLVARRKTERAYCEKGLTQ